MVVNRNKRGNYVTWLYEESSLSNLQVASPTAPGWPKNYTLKRTVAFERQRVIGLIIIVIVFVFLFIKATNILSHLPSQRPCMYVCSSQDSEFVWAQRR